MSSRLVTKQRFHCDNSGDNCAGVEVQLELEGTDKYGRTLAYLWIDEVLYNDYGEKHQYSDQVKQAADQA